MCRVTRVAAICVLGAAIATPGVAAAATLGPSYLGGPGVKGKPAKISVGAKGVWERLRWRGWTRPRATARGVYDIAGFAGEPGTGYRSRIFLKVSGRKRCADGVYVYLRVRWRVRKPLSGRRVFSERFSGCPS